MSQGDRQDDKDRNRRRSEWQGEDSKERYFRNLEENSYTIFVDNLPSSTSKAWLWQLFSFEGRIVDIHC